MADAKKGKMSKADKERLKKEEQERKALEEEAAKLKAMEDAKKQKKEAAAMAIERGKKENEERRRRRENMTELQNILDKNANALLDLSQNRRVQAKWARYMRCDGSPDPSNQGEINTYINLKKEDNSRNDAVSVLKDSLLDLSLVEELSYLLSDTPAAELSDTQRTLSGETMGELEKLVGEKLDKATLQILCDATKLSNPETNNLEHVVSNDEISLCVWGNLTKNPRIRQFEFSQVHVTFDIPKVLALSDCAVRVLITKYDHLSPSSKSILPRRKVKEPVVPEVPEGEEKKDEEEGEKENKEGEDGEKPEGEDGEEPEKEETELDLMAALRGAGGDEEEKEEEEEPQAEQPEEDFEDPTTPEPIEWEDFDEEDDIIDLRANDVLGGIYHINLLQMPPQPKAAAAWTITQLVDPEDITHMEYVPDPPAPEGETKNGAKDKDAKKDEKPPITISMTLPQDVLFLEEPQVAHWDANTKFFSTKNITDINYNEEARSLSFKANSFGTLCLLQDAHINMPFQSWEIRPHSLNSCVLSIIAAIVEIEIEIKDALCCLKQPHDKPELESIRNRWVTPAELIKMMKRAGVNVFPNEDSSKYVSIQNKDTDNVIPREKHPLIESRIYQQMALTASAMAYSWSKWNGETEREQCVFQASEALEDEPLLEEDWWVFLATKRRVTKLKMTEFDDNFSDEPEGDGDEKKPQSTSMSSSNSKNGSRIATQKQSPSLKVSPSNRSVASIAKSNIRRQSKYSKSTQLSPTSAPRKTPSAINRSPTSKSVRSSFSLTSRLKKGGSKKNPFVLSMGVVEEDKYVSQFYTIYDIEKSLFKSNIYHLMKDITSETAQQRVQDSSYQFVDCVEQLLRATKVLTYA